MPNVAGHVIWRFIKQAAVVVGLAGLLALIYALTH